jgi:hypothetical protein
MAKRSKLATVQLTREAQFEFEQARLWYEGRQPGLGLRFAADVDASIERIRESPTMYARVKKEYRQVLLQRFPFALYYEYVGGQATIYTVFHCSQDPDKLDARLP